MAEPGSQLATGARGLRLRQSDSPGVPGVASNRAMCWAFGHDRGVRDRRAEDGACGGRGQGIEGRGEGGPRPKAVAEAEARAAVAVAKVSDAEAEIAFLKLTIKKLQREIHGQRSERKQRLLDQLELQLDELEASATEDELAAEKAASETTEVQGFRRRRSGRKPFPAHLPRERVVVPAPTSCSCCGSEKLSKIGEDVTETLEVIPRQWKVIQTVREKFTCRACEKISQPPAPFHATPRGWAGPNLLAMILFEKYGQHQPLNRQRDRYEREGVDLSLSTLADQVGACTVALRPLHDLIADHVLAAERLHGDDTPVPVLARGRCATGRAWVYVRDDRPFGGPDPPAALFRYSRDRSGDHPVEHLKTFAGILQADIYAGYNPLYAAGRSPGPVIEAPCWAHSRRKFFDLADIAARKWRGKDPPPVSPLALEAVKRIDLLFDIERGINGKSAEHRLAMRKELERAGAGRSQGVDAGRAGEAVEAFPGGQGDGLHAQALGAVRPLPRRRPHLPDEQRRRESPQGYCPGPQVMALRRLGPRRRARGGDVHADRHRQAQRRRSAGLARRCPRPHRGHAADPAPRTPPLELGPRAEARSSRIEPAPPRRVRIPPGTSSPA